jgi:hypothetical protein
MIECQKIGGIMNAKKNKYFKPLIYSVVVTFGMGMIAMGIMWVVGPLSLTMDPSVPIFPRLGGLFALVGLLGFLGVVVFGALFAVSGFKNMPQKPVN